MFINGYVTFWLIMFIVFLGVELFTYGLISIWLCVGALMAMIVSFFKVKFIYQMFIFIVTSAITIIITKPLVKKLHSPKIVHTNADMVIGETAFVTETINNTESLGEVKVEGKAWSAKSINGEIIEKGNTVKVMKIEGVTLFVEKLEENKENSQEKNH